LEFVIWNSPPSGGSWGCSGNRQKYFKIIKTVSRRENSVTRQNFAFAKPKRVKKQGNITANLKEKVKAAFSGLSFSPAVA